MKRTTIFIDEKAERELDFLAERRGEPKAMLVREAIAEYLVRQREEPEVPLSFVGIGRSGRSDIAESHEELLFQHAPATVTAVSPETDPGSPPQRAKRKSSPQR